MRMYRLSLFFGLVCLAAILGCFAHPDGAPSHAAQTPTEKKPDAKVPDEVKKVPIGRNIVLEVQGEQRRVRISAEVCLREGLLEQLLTRKRTKEHEAILAADIDVRELHLALTLTGATPGSTVRFRPKLEPPNGTKIKVFLEYRADGKIVRVPGQSWIRSIKTKKDLPTDHWVFAGSMLLPDPLDKTKPPFYLGNDGDVITVVNFEGSCVDVPFLSTKDNDDLSFEAVTDRIPVKGTPVAVLLEPILEKQKK